MLDRPSVAVVCLVLCLPAAARDWSEPARVIDPLLIAQGQGVQAGGLAVLEYNYQAFLSSYDDLFQINALSGFGVASLVPEGRTVQGAGLAVAYGSYLMNGAVQEGDSPGSRLQWMMNAVQLEYGLFLALRLLGVDLLGDYSRTSQHPFRDDYSQVASDVLRAGALARVGLPFDVDALVAVRLGYCDLFDFWESPLPKPRTRVLVSSQVWLERPLTWFAAARLRARVAFAEGHLVWLFLRSGGQGINASFRAGLRLVLGMLSCDLYLDGFASDDSEIRDDGATPVGLLGWGIRLGAGAPQTRGSRR